MKLRPVLLLTGSVGSNSRSSCGIHFLSRTGAIASFRSNRRPGETGFSQHESQGCLCLAPSQIGYNPPCELGTVSRLFRCVTLDTHRRQTRDSSRTLSSPFALSPTPHCYSLIAKLTGGVEDEGCATSSIFLFLYLHTRRPARANCSRQSTIRRLCSLQTLPYRRL